MISNRFRARTQKYIGHAELDVLGRRLRQLLNVAAVEGEEFTTEVAAAVLGRDMVHVITDLGEIESKGLFEFA